MRFPIVSFNAGELSPQIDARSDVNKYASGCRTLENMIPRIYGTAERRPGTKYIDDAYDHAVESRLIEFEYSNTIAYIVEFSDQICRFFIDGGVLQSDGVDVTLATPYLAGDLFQLQYIQSNDVMWIVHPNYAPRKLTRTSATAFSLDVITFVNGPFLPRNDLEVKDDVTLTSSVIAEDATGTLTASAAMFEADHVGALFKLTQPRVNTITDGSGAGTGVIGSAIDVEGPFTFNTHGTWTATVELQRNEDGTNWEIFRAFPGANDRNVQFAATEETEGVQYRINVTSYTSGTIQADITVDTPTQDGIVRVDSFVSTTVVNITVLSALASTDATKRWYEGAWSAVRGYPTTVTFFEERTVYAGTATQPQTVWFSATGDFENFKTPITLTDSSSFSLTASSDKRNAIRWISALEALIFGTVGGEWHIRSSALDQPITPTNFSMKQQTGYGGKAMQAIQVGDVLLFVDYVGRKVREVTWSDDKAKYIAPDLSALAEHITKSGITSMAYQRNPDSILWLTLGDGTLLSMTYERDQDVVAWARHPMPEAPGTAGERTTTTTTYRYPTLQELTADEIPTTPASPALTALTSPISVTTAAHLQAMVQGNHYSIDGDIDMTGESWTPLTWNSDVDSILVEGNNHTISNLSLTHAGDDGGFIGAITGDGGGEVRNLNFEACTVAAHSNGAIFCGRCYPYTASGGDWVFKNINFTNCTVSQIATGSAESYTGMLFGRLYGIGTWISGCTVTDGMITTPASGTHTALGGLIGAIDNLTQDVTNVVDCHCVRGTVHAKSVQASLIGGLVGSISSAAMFETRDMAFYECTSSMSVMYTAPPAESLCDLNTLGGMFGYFEQASSTSCSCTGDITIQTSANWVATDLLTGIGGYIGNSCCHETHTNCYCTGSITVEDNGGEPYIARTGGFAGYFDHDVICLRCYSTSPIDIFTTAGRVGDVGGFVGWLDCDGAAGDIQRCWSEGDIHFHKDATTNGQVGGFAGYISGDQTYMADIINCYTWSSIIIDGSYNANMYFGGFSGYSWDKADMVYQNCYCAQTDSVYGSGLTNQIPKSTSSGFSNSDDGDADEVSVTACYFDQETYTGNDSVIGEPQTTEWLMLQSNFEDNDWDFDTIWEMPPITTTTEYSSAGLGSNSVAVIPGTNEDEVWISVGRRIGGETKRFIEQMQPRDWGEDDEDAWFVDAGLKYDGTPATVFKGLGHLEGETVKILGDGAVFPDEVVADAQITLDESASVVIVGKSFRYKLKPMRADVNLADGNTKGSIKKITEVVISLLKAGNVEYGTDTDDLRNIDFRTDEDYDNPPALFTGDKVPPFDGGFSSEDSVLITSDSPLPCTVRAMVYRGKVTGR